MTPLYIPDFIKGTDKEIFEALMKLNWLDATPARKEYFMSEQQVEYTYGSGTFARTYKSSDYDKHVGTIQVVLNTQFGCSYNICFLNRYDSQKNQLGWHADDSPEMNHNHSIAVVSMGAEREIWWKHKDFKGEIPKENRQLLASGSLFIMPPGFQKDYVHRIPKADHAVGTRISLTFRNYKPV